MRIASLLPSATEIVCALGLRDSLVAITHECDYPAGLDDVPVVTSSVLASLASGGEIDRHIRQLVHRGSSIYHLDAERLLSLNPELILTQELCEVCAVSYPVVEDAARRMDGPVRLVSLEPQSLEDVFANISLVGELTGCELEARSLVTGLAHRAARLKERLADCRRRSIICLEWIDPPFNAGHWTPRLVELAGARDSLGNPGRPATSLRWEDVTHSAAEAVVVMACGMSLARSVTEAEAILPALDGREVWVVDGNAYFSRPGPRLVDSAEIMAGILHPELVDAPALDVARRLA